jgi:hypothetical protein
MAQVKIETPQLSLVVGFEVATDAVHNPAAVVVVMFDGQVTTGF